MMEDEAALRKEFELKHKNIEEDKLSMQAKKNNEIQKNLDNNRKLQDSLKNK